MKKVFGVFLKAVLAGFCIGLGGVVGGLILPAIKLLAKKCGE